MMRKLFLHNTRKRGVAAIEFAFIAPVLIIISIGMFELAGYSNANIKFTNATQLLGELVAEQNTMTNIYSANFCTGSKYALAPLDTSSFKATIASVTNYSSGIVVDWQDTSCGGAAMGVGSAISLASSLIPNVGDSTIIVSASYTYTSPITLLLSPSYSLTQLSFTRPRNVVNGDIPHS